jgi:hypothetical protein
MEIPMSRDKFENSGLRPLTAAANNIHPGIPTISACSAAPEVENRGAKCFGCVPGIA